MWFLSFQRHRCLLTTSDRHLAHGRLPHGAQGQITATLGTRVLEIQEPGYPKKTTFLGTRPGVCGFCARGVCVSVLPPSFLLSFFSFIFLSCSFFLWSFVSSFFRFFSVLFSVFCVSLFFDLLRFVSGLVYFLCCSFVLFFCVCVCACVVAVASRCIPCASWLQVHLTFFFRSRFADGHFPVSTFWKAEYLASKTGILYCRRIFVRICAAHRLVDPCPLL